MIDQLTKVQKQAIEFYNHYNVPVQWFVGHTKDDDSREFIAMGDGFVWSILVDADGTTHTSEAEVGEFTTGITV